MDAAIQKILSENIDLDEEDVVDGDFREVSSGSEDEQQQHSDDIPSSDEDEENNEEEDNDNDNDDDEGLDDDDDIDEGLDDDLINDSDDDSDPDQQQQQDNNTARKGFLDGGKSDTFANAFSRILESSAPQSIDAPILAGSKSISKRRAEEEAATKADRAAKKLRMEMRQRGHVIPGRRGQDPGADAKEKTLQRVATRGVVKLFNAIAKAQRQLKETQEATGNRAKAAKLGRASFLAELKNAKTGGEMAVTKEHVKAQQRGDDESAGWNVLKEGFTGLQSGGKMKDWDKQIEEEQIEEEGIGVEGEDEMEDDGW